MLPISGGIDKRRAALMIPNTPRSKVDLFKIDQGGNLGSLHLTCSILPVGANDRQQIFVSLLEVIVDNQVVISRSLADISFSFR